MYSKGRHVRNRITDQYGEVLEAYGHGVYLVRYAVSDDEDRDFDIQMASYYDLEPVPWIPREYMDNRHLKVCLP